MSVEKFASYAEGYERIVKALSGYGNIPLQAYEVGALVGMHASEALIKLHALMQVGVVQQVKAYPGDKLKNASGTYYGYMLSDSGEELRQELKNNARENDENV